MRDASYLALSAALTAALLGITSAGSAQAVPPAWSPPPSIAPVFGNAPPASAPIAAPPTSPELRLDDADVALRATFGVGNAPEYTLDSALLSRGYSTNATLGFDVALTFRAVGWLFLGARLGSRWRTIDAPSGGTASEQVQVSGTEVLGVAELRIPIGGVELTPDVAVGVAYAEVVQTGGSVTRAAPRFSLGFSTSLWLSEPLRLVARIGWDAYPVLDVNRFGHNVGLGGPRLEFGLEWRR